MGVLVVIALLASWQPAEVKPQHYPPARLEEFEPEYLDAVGLHSTVPRLTICGLSTLMTEEAQLARLPLQNERAEDHLVHRSWGNNRVRVGRGCIIQVEGVQIEDAGKLLAVADGYLRRSELERRVGPPLKQYPDGAHYGVGDECFFASFRAWSGSDPVVESFKQSFY